MEGKHLPGFGVLVPHPPTSKPPNAKPPALSHGRRLSTIRSCSESEQKGIYSDIIAGFTFQVKARQPLQMVYHAVLAHC